MATNNAINAPFPFAVNKGGSGTNTLLDHGILVGSGTAAITPLGAGINGQLLVGGSASDPLCIASSDGNFSFTSATAGTDRILTVSNTDNSNAASAATLQVSAGGASAGDPATIYTTTANSYIQGIDNSTTDMFKRSAGTALGTTDRWIMTSTGIRTMPVQPAFQATFNAGGVTNVTGDGTVYTIAWDLETFDDGSNFSTPNFTAPVTGKYRLSTSILLNGIASANFRLDFLQIVTTSATYVGSIYNIGPAAVAQNCSSAYVSVLAPMTAGDTAYVQVKISGATKVADIYATATDTRSLFSGCLVC